MYGRALGQQANLPVVIRGLATVRGPVRVEQILVRRNVVHGGDCTVLQRIQDRRTCQLAKRVEPYQADAPTVSIRTCRLHSLAVGQIGQEPGEFEFGWFKVQQPRRQDVAFVAGPHGNSPKLG